MKKLLCTMLAAVMMFALVACGSTEKPVSSSVASANSSTASMTGTPTIDAIRASGKLVMLTNASFAPFEYVNDNEVQGVDADLAKLIADELGVELVIENMNFDLLVDAVKNGKGNLVAAGMSITEERLKAVDFSVPYVDTQLVIVVKEGSDIVDSTGLNGKTVAVQESTTSHLFLQDDEDLGVKNIMSFKSAVEAGTALATGKCDAVVMDLPTAQNIVSVNEGLVILDEVISEEQYAMAVAKGQEDFLAVVNKVLEQAIKDGVVDELVAKHMEASK